MNNKLNYLLIPTLILILIGSVLSYLLSKKSPPPIQPTPSSATTSTSKPTPSPTVMPAITPTPILTPAATEFFTYAKNDQIFSVLKSESKVLNKFTALELSAKSEECGTDKSEQYFKELLSPYSKNDIGTEYQFKYREQTQIPDAWIVTVIPNKIGYTDLESFKGDLDICEAGSSRYPFLLSEKYLLFVSSCGSGGDDGSGLPHGCDIVRGIVEPTIDLK